MDIYLERGLKLVFASAIDWPGYARSAKSDDAAIERLIEYGDRYAAAIKGFKAPKTVNVVERLKGGSGTDFGVLSIAPEGDDRDVSPKEFKRLVEVLEASWGSFDAMAKTYARRRLATGPRGGGRDIKRMTTHVLEADTAYLSSIGGRWKGADMKAMRREFLERLEAHWRGEPIENKRRTPPWSVRYCVRRSAWHALDHAWEIEDRAG